MEDEYYDLGAAWHLIPEHMHGAVLRYVMRGIAPGSFLTALLENDFMGACGRADAQNLSALPGWATFVYNYMPSQSHGSPAAVDRWIAEGGIKGRKL